VRLFSDGLLEVLRVHPSQGKVWARAG
jgi:hypothetical protein